MIRVVALVLAGWVVVSVPVALVAGRVLGRCSRARDNCAPPASGEDREAA